MDTDTLEKSMEESYQTEHTLSVMYPGEMKTPVLTKTYTWIFTEDELLRARNWKQSKCLLRGEWMARLLALGYYLVTKRNRLLVYAISWTERRGFEVSKKNPAISKGHMLCRFICIPFLKWQNDRDGKQIMVARGYGDGLTREQVSIWLEGVIVGMCTRTHNYNLQQSTTPHTLYRCQIPGVDVSL